MQFAYYTHQILNTITWKMLLYVTYNFEVYVSRDYSGKNLYDVKYLLF